MAGIALLKAHLAKSSHNEPLTTLKDFLETLLSDVGDRGGAARYARR